MSIDTIVSMKVNIKECKLSYTFKNSSFKTFDTKTSKYLLIEQVKSEIFNTRTEMYLRLKELALQEINGEVNLYKSLNLKKRIKKLYEYGLLRDTPTGHVFARDSDIEIGQVLSGEIKL